MLDPLRNMLRRRKVAGLLLHHVSRAGNDYRGTSAIGAAIELGFRLSRLPDDPEARDRRRLRCFKCRPAPEPPDRWLRLHLERGQVFIDAAEPFERDEQEQPAAPRIALAPALLDAAAEPATLADLARAIDRDPKNRTVRRLCADLVDGGELERLDDGRYRRVSGVTPLATPDTLEGCHGVSALGEMTPDTPDSEGVTPTPEAGQDA